MAQRCNIHEIESQNLSRQKQALNVRDAEALAVNTQVLDDCRKRKNERRANRVALVQPRKGGRPALGLLYVGAYLEDAGYEVKVFEFLDELYPPNIKFNQKVFKNLLRFAPDIVGFGVISSTMRITERLMGHIHRALPESIFICGGKHASSNPEELLRAGAVYCVLGEGEITVVDLLDAINFDRDPASVAGIAFLKNGAMMETGQRPFMPLDAILRPAFNLVDYHRYIECRLQSIPGHYLRCGFIFGSRGCPYKCSFCTTNVRGVYRERSIDDMLDEMRWQIDTYGVEAFVILDDLFYFKEERVTEFCCKVIDQGIKTKFMCHGRVDRVNKEIIQLMKDAGLFLLAVGVESGSQKVLDAMHKGTKIAQIEKAFAIYNEVGINTFAFIIVGHPVETAEDRELTRGLLQRIHSYNVAVNYYMPMPGTPSYAFELDSARHLIGGDDFTEFSYTTDFPEFSTTVPLEELKRIGDEFQALSVVNRNWNLFKYPAFMRDMFLILFLRPDVLIEAFWLRYVAKKIRHMSLMSLIKDAISFHRQRFFNP